MTSLSGVPGASDQSLQYNKGDWSRKSCKLFQEKFPQESETALKAGSQIAEATDIIKNLGETPSAIKVRFENIVREIRSDYSLHVIQWTTFAYGSSLQICLKVFLTVNVMPANEVSWLMSKTKRFLPFCHGNWGELAH